MRSRDCLFGCSEFPAFAKTTFSSVKLNLLSGWFMASVISKLNEFYISKDVCILFRMKLRGLYALLKYCLCLLLVFYKFLERMGRVLFKINSDFSESYVGSNES
jgi:hypothetical protein